MMPLVNNEWISWLTYEKDERGNAKLKSDAPKYIVEQYERYQKNKENKISTYFK